MVTGVGGGGLGEQIVKALKIASTPYKIIGSDIYPESSGLQCVDYPNIVPAASDPSYIESIIALCERYQAKAIFPGSEPELMVLSQNRDMIKKAGILMPINPHAVIEKCLDKAKTMSFLEENGYSHPRYIQITSLHQLKNINFFPVVLKPSKGAGGSANTFIAQSTKERDFFGKYLFELTGGFICQEYVGLPQNEYTVGVLLGLDGKLINSIAIRRNLNHRLSCHSKIPNRTNRKDLGSDLVISSGISQGEIGSFPSVTRLCEEIAVKLGCTSTVNIQCRLVNGKPCIFEINPRFSGTTSLRAMVGYNEPDIMIRRYILKEESVCGFSYRSGIILRGLNEFMIEREVQLQTWP